MKFIIYTLGCKVNTYESNVIKDNLINAGYEEANGEIADIYVINTCTVTNTGDTKSLRTIRKCIRSNKEAIIIVCGCMSQMDYHKANIPGVSIILGNQYKAKIVEFIHRYITTRKQLVVVDDIMDAEFETMKLNNFDYTRAFVKIEDGCDNYCTFCIIPYVRGHVRSKEPRLVLEEINSLINKGHKEIVLTGIHTGHYGSDLSNYTFADLLKDILKIPGLERLRISSIEITEIDNDILSIMNDSSIIVDHLHIPIQSGSNQILSSMNRKYDKELFKNKVTEIRKVRPSISLTTDLIIGFPDETEECFQETIDTINDIGFSKIHVFPYSLRKGTKAEFLPNPVDSKIKRIRVSKMIELSKTLEIEYMNQFINQEVEVIPESYKDGYIIGHTGNYLLVKFPGDACDIHTTCRVLITSTEYPYSIAQFCK